MIFLNSPTFALRYYKVFNLDLTENVVIDNKLIGEDNKIIPSAYNLAFSFLKRVNIKLNSWKSQACYYPKSDKIDMPDLKQFDSSDNYYKTLFHEITHSTGIEKRLNRYETGELLNESKEDYSKEELVAELGSLFLSSHSGLDVNIKNSSAYIRGWCKALKDDHQLIISASSKAQKAFDYITK
jgi:antirestriction protein ArdC